VREDHSLNRGAPFFDGSPAMTLPKH
jgi:hypothetical protein